MFIIARRTVLAIAPRNSNFQCSGERNTKLSLQMENIDADEESSPQELFEKGQVRRLKIWDFRFPDNPAWSDVEPYYMTEYQPGHSLTYMVKDAGMSPQSFWVDEMPQNKEGLRFVLPYGQVLCIKQDVSKSYSPKSLEQTKKDLANATGNPESSFDNRGSTQLAFLWLFLFGSVKDRLIIKSFAEKPCVFYVDVERVRLTLAYTDRDEQ